MNRSSWKKFLYPRFKAAIIAGPCVAMLIAGWSLSPRASGYGTARQLGLPSCSFLMNSGWPCPSCGLTTSVAAAVRGDILHALRAQPFGVVLTLAAFVLASAGLAQLVSGRDCLGAFHLGWPWLAAGLVGMLLGWAVVLLLGMAEGTWPMR